MKNNHRRLLIHTCDIQRADVDVNTSTIRDRRVAKYDTVKSSAPCWFEPQGTQYQFNDQLGQIVVKSFTVHFLGGENVVEGDRLKKDSTYYLVRSVDDNTAQGFHIRATVEQKNYAMGQ